MACKVEDEVDWSDGILAPERPTLTRAQRARTAVRLNRQPSETDYTHFALYQANQRAYEAIFLKHFVNHALHPFQIEQCFQQGTDACSNIKEYVMSVLANVNGIASKMTWNAHCRAVHLLANAGKDGAPLWDVGSFDRAIFTDFNPSNTVPVAHMVSESWHRVASKPPMVRYTTKDYPIGYHPSPLEEVDDVAHTLFNLSGHHPTDNTTPRQDQVHQVSTWPKSLLDDHKRRLAERCPNISRRALPGIRGVIDEAIQQGYYPVHADPEALIIDIESRERIKHALGHYYNAGDRKNCPGCFTALSDNTKALTMDFYLPSRTHYHQPNPTSSWRPSKPFGMTFGRARCSKPLSHNSIAKEAYWAAIDKSSNLDEARKLAVDAVLQHLTPKPPPREPTPAPTPTPEPDLGPHPSGSTTMEYSQDIPYCAYFQEREICDDFAWRCDVNHALGRYYLAGDKRSCPGCGSNKGGLGRHVIMDFHLPPGVCIRQEMSQCLWKPRKPYKAREGRDPARKKSAESTHNQFSSRKYREAVEAGKSPEDALVWAVEETDRWLDEKEERAVGRAEERANRERSERSKFEPSEHNERSERGTRKRRAAHDSHTPRSCSISTPASATATHVNDADTDETDDDGRDDETYNAAPLAGMENAPACFSSSSSSSSDTSSDSDSE